MNKTHIFGYCDGEQDVWGDPLEIHHTLTALLDGDVNKVLGEAHSADATISLEAMRKLIPAVREAFSLKDFDSRSGEGASWKVCVDALNAFVAWEEVQKKTGGLNRTSCSAVAEPMSSPCPTSTLSASGSTSTGPTGARPATSSAA